MSDTYTDKIQEAAQRLGLKEIDSALENAFEEARKEDLSFAHALSNMFEQLALEADERSKEALIRFAKFPYRKTFDDFDFEFQTSISLTSLQSHIDEGYLSKCQNLIFLGPPGVGKTHVATSFGMAAANSRNKVQFISCSEMIARLRESKERNSYLRKLASLARPTLLIIDEVGYSTLTQDDSAMFFDVVCRRYERGSIIITSNKSYKHWGEIFSGDDVIATAILDRLLHHSKSYVLKGTSYRMKERGKETKL